MPGSSHQHLPGGAHFDPSAGGLGSLPRSWATRAASHPERACLAFGAETLTYGDLEAASRRAAGRLHAAGLRPGEPILFSAGASAGLVVAHVACLRLGLETLTLSSPLSLSLAPPSASTS